MPATVIEEQYNGLEHKIVDSDPGTPGDQTPAGRANMPFRGSAILHLTNQTEQNNAFRVRLRCDSPFWRPDWYRLSLMTGTTPTLAEKIDEEHGGPTDPYLDLRVPPGARCDVLIQFVLPKVPDSRAGRYHYTVEVETYILAGGGATRPERLRKFPAELIVQPFYEWNVDLAPAQQRVGRVFRRTRDYDLVVTNRGNDWLYCNIRARSTNDLFLKSFAGDLAVPPPQPGEQVTVPEISDPVAGYQRLVPIRAVTRLKAARGEDKPQPLDVTFRRLDAPSVRPPINRAGYDLQGAVISSPAPPTEQPKLLGQDYALIYRPPIPASWTDAIGRGIGSIKGAALTIVGLIILVHLAALAWGGLYESSYKLQTVSSEAQIGKQIGFSGKWLLGSHMILSQVPSGLSVDLPCRPYKGAQTNPDQCGITINDPRFNNKTFQVTVNRLGLSPIQRYIHTLWKSVYSTYTTGMDTTTLTIGNPPTQAVPSILDYGGETVTVHTPLIIGGEHIPSGARVMVNGKLGSYSMQADGLHVNLDNYSAGTTVRVDVVDNNGTELKTGAVTLVAPAASPATPGAKRQAAASSTSGATRSQPHTSQPSSNASRSSAPKNDTAYPRGGKPHTGATTSTVPAIVKSSPIQNGGPPPLTPVDMLLRQQWQAALNAVGSDQSATGYAVRSIAEGNLNSEKNLPIDQAETDATKADSLASTPQERCLAMLAQGWYDYITLAHAHQPLSSVREEFQDAVTDDPTSVLAEVSLAEAQVPSHRLSGLENLLSDPKIANNPSYVAAVDLKVAGYYAWVRSDAASGENYLRQAVNADRNQSGELSIQNGEGYQFIEKRIQQIK